MIDAWVVTDGRAGMEAQGRALATAMGLNFRVKHVYVRPSMAWIPNIFFTGPLAYLVVGFMLTGDVLRSPWPRYVITCGRRGAIMALGMRALVRSQKADCKFIHIQDPHVPSRYFDVVVAMEHDAIEGANVIKTRYALHSISKESLAKAASHFAPQFAYLPRPLVAVLIGGSTNKYTLGDEAMRDVIGRLKTVLDHERGSLVITPSRRTGERNVALLKEALGGHSDCYIYDGKGENPYMGLLALADYVAVTDDSVNMMSEARATEKPVYLLPLKGHTDSKPVRFAKMLVQSGAARVLKNEPLASWQYFVHDDMASLATDIRTILGETR